jgi:CPA2 family monovalent cation:H+ antiporter-2
LGDFVVRYLLCLVIEPEKQKIKASEGLSNHVVIFGFGRMGQTVARLLSSERIPYVGVDCESSVVRSAKKNFNVFYGDATHKSIIGHTRIDTARLAVVAIGKPAPTYRTVCALRKYWPDLPIIARAHSANEMEKLKEAGVNIVIEETLESSLSLAQHVIRAFGFSSQKIKAFQKQSL